MANVSAVFSDATFPYTEYLNTGRICRVCTCYRLSPRHRPSKLHRPSSMGATRYVIALTVWVACRDSLRSLATLLCERALGADHFLNDCLERQSRKVLSWFVWS